MNDKYKVKIDPENVRYNRFRKAFKEDIVQKLECEDYEKIIDYIFKFTFELNKSKDEIKKEMDDIFQEDSDYLIDLLTRLLEKYYGNLESSDLIEEIYEDKPNASKGLSSQVVKPSSSENRSKKSLIGQAMRGVKEGRGKPNYQRNKYDTYDDNNYNNYDHYQNQRNMNNFRNNSNNMMRKNHYQNQNNQRRKGSYNNDRKQENINVGGRNLVVEKRRDKNSPSRSRSRERSKEKERSYNQNNDYSRNIEMGGNDEYQNQNYPVEYHNENRRQYVNTHYYQQPRGNMQGYYQPRRLGPNFMTRGRFPGRFVKQRFLGMTRMPIMRRPFLRKGPMVPNNQFIQKQEAPLQTNVENQQNVAVSHEEHAHTANVQQHQHNNEPIEHKEVTEHHPQQVHMEHGSADDKTNKKKIRCRNWPICKNENCEYAHPTETCQYFPKCQFGSKCLYIHPNIPCKYGFYCTRLGCSYSHGSGFNPGMFGMIPPTMTHFGGANKFKGKPQGNKPAAVAHHSQPGEIQQTEISAGNEETQININSQEGINETHQ